MTFFTKSGALPSDIFSYTNTQLWEIFKKMHIKHFKK